MYIYRCLAQVTQDLAHTPGQAHNPDLSSWAQEARAQALEHGHLGCLHLGCLPPHVTGADLAGWTVTAFDSSQIYPDRNTGRDWYAVHTAWISWAYTAHNATLSYDRQVQAHPLPPDVDWYHAHAWVTQARDRYEIDQINQYGADANTLVFVDGARTDASPAHVIGYVSQPRSTRLTGLTDLAEQEPDCRSGLHMLLPGEYVYIPGVSPALLLHTGTEIARVDMPATWYEDPARKNILLSALALHLRAGRGYPLALAYAHELAVLTHQVGRCMDMMRGAQVSQKKVAKEWAINSKTS